MLHDIQDQAKWINSKFTIAGNEECMLDLGGHRTMHLTFMHDIKYKLQITEVWVEVCT